MLFPLLGERVRVRASVKPFFAVVVLLLCLALRAFAHDPYEITATIRIETNRTSVEIEMEFNGAMLLVGEPRSREPVDQPALFQSKLLALRRQAGQFFEVGSAGRTLAATSTNVSLGAENHVRFNLEYPATRSGLKLNAAGLKSLSEHGPFGTTVTVLDMVSLKVLGQSVLFAESPVAEFAPVATEQTKLVSASVTSNSPAAAAVVAPVPAKPAASPAKNGFVWMLLVLGGFAVVLVVLIRRWQSAGGSQ